MNSAGGASGSLNIEFDTQQIDAMALDVNATLPQVEAALASALRRMALYLKAASVKGLSHELDVQQKVIRRRLSTFRLSRSRSAPEIKLWYGLNPLSMEQLGTPKQTAQGVRVGKHFIAHAFLARDKTGRQRVFLRKGKARLPIEKQVLDIADDAERWIEDKLFEGVDFETKFFQLFEHELRWRTKTAL
ncbi:MULTISPECIES: prophage LambdaW5, minor tail protein Z-like protein [unclassified Acidocella]|uniref:prophage LambdaW5, minor tail protein Z-like protein n=1 Tax=unclassified Acidocella TaxID=2648610 RepID=UPI00028E30EA|nr:MULTISPECIES: prophage LambdaW5, minor tail protein Z-like protein [unclassified Acidocella]EKN01118.1 prophage LambdaW5, minor tail protein Z-like protein [Acidocella sp. MX-AZ02]WBO60549.1 phage tail protein [Acidocella sp. MX-AZ03]